MPVFEHRGRRISYLDTIPGPLAATPVHTLLLLHAFPMNAGMWEPQLAAVPDGWRFVAPDFRGFGQSDADGSGFDLRIDDYALDAAALLDYLGVDRAVVAGLSMGGYVAFALFRLAAARVAGLVLADTKAEPDTAEARSGRLEMIRLLEDHGVPAVVERLVPRLLCEQTRRERPEIEGRVRALALTNRADGLGSALVRMMDRPDSSSLLPHIDCPTLVIVGDEDAAAPPEQARTMQRQIAAAQIVEIPHAGHLSNLEQTDRFNAALRSFLAALPPESRP